MSGRESRTPANQMQQQVKRGQSPKSVDRVDKGVPDRYDRDDHIHFKSGEALYANGEWKHGQKQLSGKEKEWIAKSGWTLPEAKKK